MFQLKQARKSEASNFYRHHFRPPVGGSASWELVLAWILKGVQHGEISTYR